jgi:hypothetical protein
MHLHTSSALKLILDKRKGSESRALSDENAANCSLAFHGQIEPHFGLLVIVIGEFIVQKKGLLIALLMNKFVRSPLPEFRLLKRSLAL